MNDMFLNLFPNLVVCRTRLVALAAQKFISNIADIAVTYYTLHCSFARDFSREPLGFTHFVLLVWFVRSVLLVLKISHAWILIELVLTGQFSFSSVL